MAGPGQRPRRGRFLNTVVFRVPQIRCGRAWKPGRHQAHHPGPLRKRGRWEKHHLHGAGPGPAPCRQEALIKQFVSDVAWGELDYLVVDTPPGTSDEHMATIEALRPYQPLGALVVTTPQAVSVGDVRRELTFCRKTGVRVMGVVENMSGFTCPHCTECTSVFSRGGGEELARLAGVPFLGECSKLVLGSRPPIPSLPWVGLTSVPPGPEGEEGMGAVSSRLTQHHCDLWLIHPRPPQGPLRARVVRVRPLLAS
nr:cytosolic Fe-S cluster assembly factor NUBP2 isoform X4 [Macaca nemestrina]